VVWVPTKSEFKKCDSIFFEKSKSSSVVVYAAPPAVEVKAITLKERMIFEKD
jgi:hypothetical protein